MCLKTVGFSDSGVWHFFVLFLIFICFCCAVLCDDPESPPPDSIGADRGSS